MELSLWQRLFGRKTVITVESRVSDVYCVLNIVAGMLLLIGAKLKNVTLLCSGLRTAQNTISHLGSVLELAYNILNETNFQLLGMLTAACFFAQDVVIILLQIYLSHCAVKHFIMIASDPADISVPLSNNKTRGLITLTN
jgi:hypothetical protein